MSSQLLSTQLASTTELNSVQNPIQPHPTARDWWHAGKRRQTKTQLAQAHILAQCVSAGCASVLVSFDHILFCSRGRWRISSLLMETRKPPFCHPIHLVVYCYGLFFFFFVILFPSLKEMKRSAECHSGVLRRPSLLQQCWQFLDTNQRRKDWRRVRGTQWGTHQWPSFCSRIHLEK